MRKAFNNNRYRNNTRNTYQANTAQQTSETVVIQQPPPQTQVREARVNIAMDMGRFGATKLNTGWQLYYLTEVNNWEASSYRAIGPLITTVETYFQIVYNLHLIPSINVVNLYLYRENSYPTREHETNNKGITWSIKTTVEAGMDKWRTICDKIVTETSLKQNEEEDINGYVNGVALMYKETNYIIKVMMSNKGVNNVNMIDNEIRNIAKPSAFQWQVIVVEN